MIKRILCTLAIAACAALSLPASAALLTDYGENRLVDALFRGQALGTPATWYVGVSTGTCNDATPGTEPTGGYARQPVSASLSAWAGTQSAGSTTASSGTGATTSNNGVIQFPASTAAWGNVQSVQLWDAVTAGNRWVCVDVAAPFNVDRAGVELKFNAGQLQFYVDN